MSKRKQHPKALPLEQDTLLAIVRGWHPSAIPEYRGFRCAACQQQINAAWYHWLQNDEYFLPVHLCDERCERLFRAGTLHPVSAGQGAGATSPAPARPPLNNTNLYSETATRRFREIVTGWRAAQTAPVLRAFTCDACGGELLMEPGPDGSPQRQGYHVWWEMEPEQTRVELHFHRDCGHALGISSREEAARQGAAGQPAPVSAALAAFRPFALPTGERALIPGDLELRVPEHSTLSQELRHFLVFIPWNERLLSRIDTPYRAFFQVVLPYLHTRTTDVHIATCFPFVNELIQASGAAVDERVIHVAFLLHDVGWSQLSEAEIAASLGVTGVALSAQAMGPKAKHAVVGKDLTERLLGTYAFDPPLTDTQQAWIAQAVLYHDKPWELAQQGTLPLEMKLVCDVDHLWSFTHENFWQDTVRKGIAPSAYLQNLGNDLDSYLVTEQGKAKARSLLHERQAEVAEWARATAALGQS
jgi:hypothetical protein